MDSSLVNKIYKAKIYAEEPERIHITRLDVEMEGDDRLHKVGFESDEWFCDCEYFRGHRVCAHTMALERVLGSLIKVPV
jgi:hypothetical protein